MRGRAPVIYGTVTLSVRVAPALRKGRDRLDGQRIPKG